VLGGLFALLAALTFAVNNATTRRGVLHASVSQAMAITVPMGVPLFLIVAWPMGALPLLGSFSPMSILYLSLAGIAHFVWGRYCNYRATKAMGSNLVAPVQQWSLVFTLGAAVLFLGETVTPLRLIGIALVLLGPMLTATGEGSPACSAERSKRRSRRRRAPAAGAPTWSRATHSRCSPRRAMVPARS
jgi:drug/metabolite transporter (DMT)-like permease